MIVTVHLFLVVTRSTEIASRCGEMTSAVCVIRASASERNQPQAALIGARGGDRQADCFFQLLTWPLSRAISWRLAARGPGKVEIGVDGVGTGAAGSV